MTNAIWLFFRVLSSNFKPQSEDGAALDREGALFKEKRVFTFFRIQHLGKKYFFLNSTRKDF